MRIAIIGRTEILYDVAERLREEGYELACILSAKEASEYRRAADDFRAFSESYHVPFAQGGRIRDRYDFLQEAGA